MNNITNIAISKLHEHPQNPRKDLGDLTELAESIKANGIFQNLTVVPHTEIQGEYTVIIGHRRMAATKQAGLTEVPCAVVKMDEKKQLSTMLLENMQRAELTVIEQAEGFQLLIDLGESVENISKETGFSKSTIYRRTKLMSLDREELRASAQRGATLEDYAKLEELDEEHKNKVLKTIGTKNFEWSFERAKRDIESKVKLEELKSKLREFAIEVEYDELKDLSKYKYADCIYNYSFFNAEKYSNDVEYVFAVTGYGSVYIYSVITEEEKEQQKQKESEQERRNLLWDKRKEWRSKVYELNAMTYEMRKKFAEKFSCTTNEQKRIISEWFLYSALQNYFDFNDDEYEKLGLSYDEESEEFFNFEESISNNNLYNVMFKAIMQAVDNNRFSYISYFDDENIYRVSTKLNSIYYKLTQLDYKLSDEEQQLKDGTHSIYKEYPRE